MAEHGVKVLGLGLDVGDYASVAAAAKVAIDWQGHVDILFNNAGGGSVRAHFILNHSSILSAHIIAAGLACNQPPPPLPPPALSSWTPLS